MVKNVKPHINAFLKGFHDIIPPDLIGIFNYRELELMISGLPNIDVENLRTNTIYCRGYNKNS